MIKLALALLTFSSYSLACEVNLPSKIYFLEQEANLEYIDSKNCNKDSISELHKVLRDTQGVLTSSQLKRIAPSGIVFKTNKVQVRELDDHFKSKLGLSADLFITDIKLTNTTNPITLNADESINLSCYKCNRVGSFGGNLVKVSPFKKERVWAQIKIKRQIEVVELTNELRNSNVEFNLNSLKKSFLKTANPSKYIKSRKELAFYKNNRPLPKGHIITRNDITPLQLVTRGERTQVIIKSNKMKMNGFGKALRNGRFGQNIELRNIKSNKTFSAKVIDKNKVLIEL